PSLSLYTHPPPPEISPFPYTTLFRSKADVVVANILAGPLRELAPLISVLPVEGGLLGLSGILASQADSVCEAYTERFALDPVVEDRKSTRLNSSHVKISYAVFCLKKK